MRKLLFTEDYNILFYLENHYLVPERKPPILRWGVGGFDRLDKILRLAYFANSIYLCKIQYINIMLSVDPLLLSKPAPLIVIISPEICLLWKLSRFFSSFPQPV